MLEIWLMRLLSFCLVSLGIWQLIPFPRFKRTSHRWMTAGELAKLKSQRSAAHSPNAARRPNEFSTR